MVVNDSRALRGARVVVIALFISLTCCIAADASDLPATIAAIKPSIVGIGTMQETRTPPAQLYGTGFAVQDGHYVVTNAHVIPRLLDDLNHEYLAVFVGTGSHPDIRKAEQIAVDSVHDVVLLKITGAPLHPVVLGDSASVREGELMAFTGFPIGSVLGMYPATTRALIAAITPIAIPMDRSGNLDPRMISQLRSPFEVFQLDAVAYPGNSGSPLFRPESGEVIAIVNMVYVKSSREKVLSDPSGIAYAMPVRYLRELFKRAGDDKE